MSYSVYFTYALPQVGFVGRHPEELLPWPRCSVLIAGLSEGGVREGSSSAKGGAGPQGGLGVLLVVRRPR